MIQQAIRITRGLLPSSSSITQTQIEEAVDMTIAIPIFIEVDRSELIREIQSIYNIRQDSFRIIEASERRRPWINDKKSSLDWNFWNRYRDFLADEKGFSNTVINQLDRLTDRTLDGLFDPTINARLSKYGLVVGQVQSGKTSNYTGLICKAADAGYKLIIVLAGTLNNLRSQTQLRLDEGFLGFDTQHQRAFDRNNHWIGVGKIDQNSIAHSLTSSLSDFTTAAANGGVNFNTNDPIIVVVKKNAGILNRLSQWLSVNAVESNGRRTIRNKSLLLIDDEADYASINTLPDEDRSTRINGLIREILGLFDRSAYVGYTATPFANIFIPIDDDQLFPNDFIINIPPPSNYVGPDRIFGFQMLEDYETSESVLPIVHRVNDFYDFVPDRHKNYDPLPVEAPNSIKTAIKCFILTCAIRRLRGQKTVHNSMLIHLSRFVRWQGRIKEIVENVFDFYRRGIEMNVPSVVEEFRQAFEDDTENYRSYVTTSELILDSRLGDIDPNIQAHRWDEVFEYLNDAASRIQVKQINGGSADALNYFDHTNGLSVIAIGGDKLSRGLTLEGLSVSYYLRASRMYDTLMQMGRWFGYRPGYVDLCRLFTSRELNEWFCHIALASEELRNEFDYMSDIAGSTPEQYALRVRTHPGVLQISASNKIRRAVTVDISWSGRIVESYEFQKDTNVIRSNLNATIDFIQNLNGAPESIGDNYLWFDISPQNIMQLLQQFRLSESLKAADPLNLLRFIEAQLVNNELSSWRVALMSKKGATKRYSLNKDGLNLDPGLYLRSEDEKNSNTEIFYIRNSRIISPRDQFIDLTSQEYDKAMELTRESWLKNNKDREPTYPSGDIVRNEIRSSQNPLLLIYFLEPKGARLPEDSDPVIGYAISFPGSRFNASVSYAVHQQLLPFFNQEDDLEEFNNDDED